MKRINYAISVFYVLIVSVLLVACGNKQPKRPPIDLSNHSNAIQIPFDDKGNNQIWITVELNGIPMKMLYDTGFNGMVSMSLHELQTLVKNNQFSQADVVGTSYSSIADGSIVENGIILLRSVKLADGIPKTSCHAQSCLIKKHLCCLVWSSLIKWQAKLK